MEGVQHEINHAIRRNRDWIQRFARFGFFTKGLVYCLLGAMTTMSALRIGGEKAGSGDVFWMIYKQPFGKILLGLTAVGLLAYAAWRLFEAVKNPAEKKIGARLGYTGSGLLYGSMAVSAATLALTDHSGSGSDTQSAISEALQQPFGKIVVVIAAVVTIAKGLYQFNRAFTGKFGDDIYLNKNKIIARTAAIGYTARGVVLGIIGYFFIRAAFHERSGVAKDTKGVFTFLENGFGTGLLAIVAFGLVCYGVFMIVRSRYSSFEVQ